MFVCDSMFVRVCMCVCECECVCECVCVDVCERERVFVRYVSDVRTKVD